MRGCSVFTRPPSISGNSVSASTRSTVEPEPSRYVAVPPLATSSQPSVDEPAREHVDAGLVVGRDQRAHSSLHDARQEAVLDRFDPFVQRLRGVAGVHRHALLREHGAGVDRPRRRDERSAADSVDARGELLLDGVRARELRQQRRVDVDDPAPGSSRGTAAVRGACSPRARRARRPAAQPLRQRHVACFAASS